SLCLFHGCICFVFSFFFLGSFPLCPGISLSPEFALCQFVAPVFKTTFCKLHNISFMNQSNRWFVLSNSILNRSGDQPLRAFFRNRLTAKRRSFRKAHFIGATYFL